MQKCSNIDVVFLSLKIKAYNVYVLEPADKWRTNKAHISETLSDAHQSVLLH